MIFLLMGVVIMVTCFCYTMALIRFAKSGVNKEQGAEPYPKEIEAGKTQTTVVGADGVEGVADHNYNYV